MHKSLTVRLKGEEMHVVKILRIAGRENRLVPRCAVQGSGAAAMPA